MDFDTRLTFSYMFVIFSMKLMVENKQMAHTVTKCKLWYMFLGSEDSDQPGKLSMGIWGRLFEINDVVS